MTQELPALYTTYGIDAHGYYKIYGDSSVTSTTPSGSSAYCMDNVHTPPSCTTASGGAWWTLCDSSEDRCLTIASWSTSIVQFALQNNYRTGGGYASPQGAFSMSSGTHSATIYLFPYKYNATVGGHTIEWYINALRCADISLTC
jgi:hypothetical protein